MKILFLDIDGVVNCSTTACDVDGFIGIDPYMALLVGRIVEQTGCKVVLSSSWRHHEESREQVRKQVVDFIDVTPHKPGDRGDEIAAWLQNHPEVKQYAILDDDSDMLPGQPLFQTSWEQGLTEEIANKVITHFNIDQCFDKQCLYPAGHTGLHGYNGQG